MTEQTTQPDSDGLAGTLLEIAKAEECMLHDRTASKLREAAAALNTAQPEGLAKDLAELIASAENGSMTDGGRLYELFWQNRHTILAALSSTKPDSDGLDEYTNCGMTAEQAAALDADPFHKSDGLAAMKQHIRQYDTPKVDDPRRRYTEAQFETAVSLAALSSHSAMREALGGAIKRFETIQETHPEICLEADLEYYRRALS